MQPQLKRIAFLLFDGCDLLDFAGPAGVFHSAARHLIRTGQASELLYTVEPLSIDGGSVQTEQNIFVETKAAKDIPAGRYDTLIVTGGIIDHRTCDQRLPGWVKTNHAKVPRVASICCGAFILAAAGLLNGRSATTHWEDCQHLQDSFPDVDVRPDSIYVQEGNLWTSAGITSGIDMALAMIEEDYGHGLALLVARNLVVFMKRPGGQSQFSAPLQSQSIEGPLGSVLGWIVENPCEDLRTEKLAERANMSLRNFFRAFEAATGTSPADWVEMARTEVAKRLLEEGPDKVEQVAFSSGFSNYEQMRKAFARRVGVSPTEYRSRFARRQGVDQPAAFAPLFFGYIQPEPPREVLQ
jgi:transcriptional regulator GlxA family with amidase domain